MKLRRLAIFLVVAFSFVSFTVTSFAEIDFDSLIRLHNETRLKNNLNQLQINVQLIDSAQRKADGMLADNCWSHYCPDGKSPWDFFNEAGYEYVIAGENLAQGFFDNNSVFNAWMNSPTHRENILNSEFNEIGIPAQEIFRIFQITLL
jgi:uncharacterized protein YkwD